MRRPWRRCSACGGVCHWHDEAWVCRDCGSEWYPEHGERYASPDPDGPLTSEGLRVCTEMCSTCVFRPGNLMQLQPGRLRGMVDDSLANDSCIPCHKTLDGERAVCRGFWDRHQHDTLACRFGAILGVIMVDPEAS